jgi:UDP-glucose 4-epimerase
MNILITGASGFIGGHLVAEALATGHEVTAAIRAGSDRSRLKDVQILELKMEDREAMTNVLSKAQQFDWVIHNAGITKALNKEDYFRVNVENTKRLVQALQASGKVPERFLLVSSLAALGAPPPEAVRIAAGQSPQPLTAYGQSKWEAEQFLESLGSTFPWVIAQPTAVYGPWERDILTVIQWYARGLELSIGSRDQRLSFIHAQDVALSVLAILKHPEALHQKIILSDGRDYLSSDVGRSIGKALGREAKLKLNIPMTVIRPLAALSEQIGRWQGKAAPLNREKLAELTAPNWHCDTQPLLTTIGYQPQFDLYSGMKDALTWYRQAGWIRI